MTTTSGTTSVIVITSHRQKKPPSPEVKFSNRMVPMLDTNHQSLGRSLGHSLGRILGRSLLLFRVHHDSRRLPSGEHRPTGQHHLRSKI